MRRKLSPMELTLGAVTAFGIVLVAGFYIYDRVDPLYHVTTQEVVTVEPVAKSAIITKPAAVPAEAENKPVYSLKTEESEYLWDLEHHNNVLTRFGFGKWIDSWRDRDRDALLSLFGDDFRGTLIRTEDSKSLTAKTERVDVSRYVATAQSSVEANRESVVDWLLEFRGQFADDPEPKGRFDVMTLQPPPADQPSDSWTVTCIHRLWGQSSSGGTLEVTLSLTLQTDAISKERMAEPGWLRVCDLQQYSSAHADEPLFRDVTDNSGIDPKALHDNWIEEKKLINTGGVYACDFNRDGFTDLLITDKRKQFYLGRGGGKFEEATQKVGLQDSSLPNRRPRFERIAAFADLDNDGWEDLVLPDSGRVFRNEEGERFRDVTYKSNLGKRIRSIPPGNIGGIVMADYNRDGLIDLYVTRSVPPVGSWLESKQPKMIANQLLRNDGDWSFSNVTEQTGTGGGGRSCFTAVWTDVNNDRWPDLYIINEFGNGALYVNEEGESFQERELIESPQDFGSMGLSCGDVNNDGNVDIYVSNMYSKAGSRIMGNMQAEDYPEEIKQKLRNMVAGGELYLNQGDLDFEPVGKDFQVHAAGWAWGSSLADLDNDGWLDLHVTAGFMSRDRNKPDG